MVPRIRLKDVRVNTKHKFGEVGQYHPVLIETPSGLLLPALLTHDQLCVAIDRATSNPEDAPKVPTPRGWFQRALGWIRKPFPQET